MTKAFLTGFQLVDRNLDRLLSTADAKTPIVLIGDHGMDAIERMVNLSALLRPSEKKVARFVTVKAARIAQASLLSAVPSLTQMMGIKPPQDCVGVSLLQGPSLTRR